MVLWIFHIDPKYGVTIKVGLHGEGPVGGVGSSEAVPCIVLTTVYGGDHRLTAVGVLSKDVLEGIQDGDEGVHGEDGLRHQVAPSS